MVFDPPDSCETQLLRLEAEGAFVVRSMNWRSTRAGHDPNGAYGAVVTVVEQQHDGAVKRRLAQLRRRQQQLSGEVEARH